MNDRRTEQGDRVPVQFVGTTGAIGNVGQDGMSSTNRANNIQQGGALVIQISEDEFYIVGYGINADITLKENIKHKYCGYASIYEGKFENNKFISGRLLNGDERSVSIDGNAVNMLKVKMYYY